MARRAPGARRTAATSPLTHVAGRLSGRGLGTTGSSGDAKRRGMEHIEEVARAESKRLSLNEEVGLRYLTETIHYDLGEREMEGLSVFARKCEEHGLAPKGAAIEFIG